MNLHCPFHLDTCKTGFIHISIQRLYIHHMYASKRHMNIHIYLQLFFSTVDSMNAKPSFGSSPSNQLFRFRSVAFSYWWWRCYHFHSYNNAEIQIQSGGISHPILTVLLSPPSCNNLVVSREQFLLFGLDLGSMPPDPHNLTLHAHYKNLSHVPY